MLEPMNEMELVSVMMSPDLLGNFPRAKALWLVNLGLSELRRNGKTEFFQPLEEPQKNA